MRLLLADNVVISSESSAEVGGGVNISSNVYIVGFSSAVKYYGDGSSLTGVYDNLGNHIATTTLDMNGNSIINASSGTFAQGVTASSFTATGTGLSAVQLLMAANVVISSESSAALGGGVNISSNVYVVGFTSATKYYGDGSELTGITRLSYTADEQSLKVIGDVFSAKSSSVTLQGNTFNLLPGQLVQLETVAENGQTGLPAIDGSQLLNVKHPTGIPAGTIMYFTAIPPDYTGDTCPDGWAEYTPGVGRYLVGTPFDGTNGATVGGALYSTENRAVGRHNHTLSDPGHGHIIPEFTKTGATTDPMGVIATKVDQSSEFTQPTGGSASNLGVTTTGDFAGTNALYLQLLICQKV